MTRKCLAIIFLAMLSACATRVTPSGDVALQPRNELILKNKVEVSVFDARTDVENKSMEKKLINEIKNVYANAMVPTQYFSVPKDKKVTVRIRIVELAANFNSQVAFATTVAQSRHNLQATAVGNWGGVVNVFGSSSYSGTSTTMAGTGRWYGVAWVDVEVIDKREAARVQFTIPLVGQRDEFNMWGYGTAKSVANQAWNQVLAQVVRLLDAVVLQLMEEESRA